MEGFECRTPLVVPPLIEPAGHRPLQAVDLGFQSGVPGDLPPPPQPVLQAYFVLNAGRYRRPWVVTWATFRSRLLISQVQAVSFYLVRWVGVSSVIGQNKLSYDWSEYTVL